MSNLNVRKQFTSTGHRAALYALAPGRDDRHVLSAGGEGWIVEWNLDDPETGRVLASVETQVFSLFHDPAARRLVAGNMNGGLHWIDLEDPGRTRNIQHHARGVFDLQTDGRWLYSAGGEGTLTRWDMPAARAVESFRLTNRALRSIAISPENRMLAVGAGDAAIYVLDLETLAVIGKLPDAHRPTVFTLAWSPDQRYLLSGGRDAMLRVWDARANFATVAEQPAHWFTINHLVYSPQGNLFATASRDKSVKIWDAASFELRKVIDAARGGHRNSVNRLLWLPDVLLSCSDDRTLSGYQIQVEN